MKSPFDDIDKYFDCFFTEAVQFGLVRRGVAYSTTVDCCVFPLEEVEPLIDSDVVSDLKSIAVVMRKKDWTHNSQLKVGDQVIYGNVEYSISRVQTIQNDFHILARTK